MSVFLKKRMLSGMRSFFVKNFVFLIIVNLTFDLLKIVAVIVFHAILICCDDKLTTFDFLVKKFAVTVKSAACFFDNPSC